MQVTNIANNPRCPTCNSRMACFPNKSWRCPKCAPQAQEEPSGAPAPACDHDWRHCITDVAEYDLCLKCWGIGDPTTGRILMIVPENQRRPQPPAPASPAGLVWTKEKPTRDGWYWLRLPGATAQCEFIVRDHENGVSRWINELSGEWEPVLDGREWAGPIPEPAAPEAGAPGTQTPNQGEK